MSMLEERIGYVFRDGSLLALALSHPSIPGKPHNQRLEFLGDAILGAVIASILYELYPNEPEGDLARRHAALVRGETLTKIAQSLNLGEALQMAAGEIQTGGRQISSNLEDALEAIIGALYLDGGFATAEKFVKAHWTKIAQSVSAPPQDAKTALQEWAQARGLPIPNYRMSEQSGPSHSPEFTIEVTVQGYAPATAKAATKRAAEQQAAGLLLSTLIGSAS